MQQEPPEKRVYINSKTIRVDNNFYDTIEEFRKKFFEKNGIQISQTKATKIVDMKIKSVGGLKV